MKKVFTIFIITLFSIILFFNCKIDANTNEKDSFIEEIKILQEPYKTKYKKGERLDLAGLVVVAVYSDGSEETITDFTTFPAEGEKLDYVGTKEVAIRKDIKKSKDSLICFAYFNIEIEEKTRNYNPTEGFVFVEGETITGSEEYSSQGNGVFTEGKHVTLNDFYMCDHEVMQGEYEIIMGKNPSIGTTNTANEESQKSRPVENISWYEAIVYCNKLSLKEGLTPCYIIEGINDWNLLSYSEIPEQNNSIWDNVVFDSSANGYRLPTEEEWEFAARGGKSTYGTASFKEDSGTDIALVEWNKKNSDGKTHEVRRKSPNALGLFDMGGNVRELCWDSNGSERIVRGGNYLSSLEDYSFLERNSILPYIKDSSIGMRITRSVIQESSGKSFTINYVSSYGQKPADIMIYDGNVLTGRNLPELSCKGYEFLGWYTSNSFEEETRITSGYIVTGDLTLYAKWIKVTSTDPQPESAQIRLVVQYPTETLTRVKKGDGILFEGVVSTINGTPTITISRQGEADENEVVIWRYEFEEDEGIENTVSGTYDFSYSRYIPETWFNQAKSQQYRVIIRADNGKIVESEKTVFYDVDGPEINITDIKPVVEKYSRECINKKITVKGFITDKFDNVDSANWALVKRDDAGEDVIIDSGNGLKSSFTFEADTGNYDYTDAFLRINAYDRAGNKTTKDLYYYIDQSTDIPTIQPNDPDTLTFDLKSKQALVETNNAMTDTDYRKNFFTGNSQILLKFTDDDGIDKITVSTTVEGQSEAATSSSVQAKNATEYTYAYKAPESEGYYRIDVVVTDKNGGTNGENFCILVSGETPSLKLTTSPEFITTNIEDITPNAKTAFTVIGLNSGSAPFKKVIRCQDGEAESDGIELAVAKFTESAEGKNDVVDKRRWVDTFIPESSNATGSVRYVLYDAYGISAEQTFNYKVDSVRPVARITSCLDKYTSNSGTFRFVGTASDNEAGSGVAKVQIRIDNYDEEVGDEIASYWSELPVSGNNSTGWIDVSGTDNWNALIAFSDYPRVFGKEGEKVLYVRVEDAVGNYNEMQSKVFIFDTVDPNVSIDKYTGDEEKAIVAVNGKKSVEVSQNFSLGGTMFDKYGIENITVEQTFGDNTITVYGIDSNEESEGNWSWLVDNLPRKMDAPGSSQNPVESGKYTYKVTVTDKSGKQSSETVTVSVDITPPTITITKPLGNITNADGSITKNFLSSDSYMFQGRVVDNEEGTGVDKYFYYLTTEDTVPDDTSAWSFATSDVDWSFAKTIADGPNAVTGYDLYEGEWKLYVKAVDKAGNVSDIVSREFSIDKAAPVISVTNLEESGITYFKGSTFTVNGTASDTYGIESVVIKNGTTPIATISGSNITNNNWSFPLQLEANTGLSLSFTATDKAGRQSETITRSVYRDTQPPSLWITSDLSGLITNVSSGVRIQGSVNDGTGCGVDKVLYSIDGSEPSLQAAITEQIWTIILTPENLPAEGLYTLKVKAVDKLGNKTETPVTGALAYDIAKPIITVKLNDGTERPVSNNNYTNPIVVKEDYFTISGTFNDTGTNVTVSATLDCLDETATTTITQTPSAAKSGTWTLAQTRRNGTQTVTDIPDGTYEYTITAIDEAGVYTGSTARKESIRFRVIKDTIAPTVTITNPETDIARKNTNAINEAYFRFEGSITEANGIQAVWYKIVDITEAAPSVPTSSQSALNAANWSSWANANYGSSTWNATQAFKAKGAAGDGIEEGNYKIYVYAVDKAGNVSTVAVREFDVDMAYPSLADASTVVRTKEGFTLCGMASDTFGLLAGTDALTISDGTQTWNVSVISSGEWAKDFVVGSSNTSAENYISDGIKTFTITAKDKAGKTASITRTVIVDTTAPVVTISTFNDSTNGQSYIFSGIVVDENLKSAVAELFKNGDATPVQTKNLTPDAEGNWILIVYNLAEGEYTLKVTATDIVDTVTTVDTASDSSYKLIVDATAPASTLSIASGTVYGADGTVVSTIVNNGKYYSKAAYTINGVITEANYDASQVTLYAKKNGVNIIAPTLSGIESKNWSFTGITSEDAEYEYKLRISDKVGNETEYIVTVVYDTTAPAATVTRPDTNFSGANSISGSAYNFTGVATDETAGILVERYIITQEELTVAQIKTNGAAGTGWTTVTSDNGTWASPTQTLITGTTPSANANTLHEGKWYVYIYAKDILGHETTASRIVWIDQSAPAITNVSSGTLSGTTATNGTVTISGNATDANGITGIVIHDAFVPTISGQTGVADVSLTADQLGIDGSFIRTYSAANLNDGEHTFTITATDVAGKTNTTTIAVVVDKTAPSPVLSGVPDKDDTKGSAFTFSGSAADATSGIEKVEITISNGIQTKTVQASGKEVWSSRIGFYTTGWTDIFGTQAAPIQGEKTVTITAYDGAGNTSTTTNTFLFDNTDPFISIDESSIGQFMPVSGFTIIGTIADTYQLGSLSLIEKKDGTPTAASGEDGYTVMTSTGTSANFSINVPLGDVTPTDGTYTYEFVLTDSVGHIVNSKIYTTTVDSTAPVVSITTPATDFTNKGVDAIAETSYRFTGTSNDTNGISAVYYKIATTAPANVPTSSTLAESTWANEGFIKVNSTINWTAFPTFKVKGASGDGIEEGLGYKIYVYAVDNAGNVSSAAVREFDVDMAAPSLTVGVTTNANCIEKNAVYYFNSENLTGTLAYLDTLAMSSSRAIRIKVDGVDITDNSTLTSTSWSIPAFNFIESEMSTIMFEATDSVGKTAIKAFSVCKDTTAPMIAIVRPEPDGNIDVSPVNARISVVENGVGIQGKTATVDSKVEYRFNGGAWTPTNYTGGTAIEQELDLGTTQGEMTLEVRATDKLGNTYITPAVTFYYDYQDPVIVETDEVERYVNGTFTLTGTAYDSYKLSYIEVKDTIDGNKVYRSDSNINTQITYTGDIENAVSAATATTWTLAFTSDDWAGFSEGNHVFKITAYDVSGRSAEVPNKNIWIDKHAPVVTSAIVPTTAQTQGSSFRFSGIAKDYNKNAGTVNSNSLDSGIKKVEIQITNDGVAAVNSTTATATATGWIDATGQEDWNTIIAFDNYEVFSTEGVKTLHIRATDESGLTSTVFTKNFVYDKAAPTLAVSTYTPEGGSALSISSTDNEPTFNVNGNFTLSGISSDNNGVKDIKIYQKIGTGDEVLLQILTGSQTASWSISGLPRNPDSTSTTLNGNDLSSGIYTYRVVVTDNAGVTDIPESTAKTASKTVKATIDKTAPVVVITNPANENANTGLNAISVVSNRFAGTASDNHDGATEVGAVWYKIIARDGTVPTAPTASTTVDSTWTGLGFKKASNTTNWFFSQAMNEGTTANDSDHICEGCYRLVVYAVDNAGNVSTPETQYFDVDMNAPIIETMLDDSYLNESMTQTKTAAYTFKYKVTETYGLAANNPVVTMKKDNVDFTGFTQSAADADSYVTVTINSQTDGLYEYTISATDLVGKNYTIRRNILLDTTPPTLSIISPDLSGYQNTLNVKVNGSSEDKSGTQAVWYSFGVASMPSVPSTNTTVDSSWTSNGWTKATGSTSWNFTVTGVEGTDKNLYIAAVDTNGKVTTSGAISAVVKVDVTNPTLTETGVGAGTQYKNAAFTLSGTAIDAGSGLVAVNPVTIIDGSTNYNPTVTSGTWIQTITPASDGEYTFTIKATDNAGRESTLSRTVIYDTVLPTVSTKAISTSIDSQKHTVNSTVWYSTSQIPVVIEGSDGDSNGSGVSTIECSTDNSSWSLLSRSGSNYIGTISCTTQGENTIYIRVTDNAGNTTSSYDTLTVNVDTLSPDTFTLGTVEGAALEGIKLVNGRETLTFTGTATDNTDGCGIASVKLTKIGSVTKNIAATNNSGTYSITIPVADMPTVTTPVNVIVTVTDNAGNSAEFTAFQMQFDNTYPLATVGNIADADKTTSFVTEVNGTITVSGTANDTHLLTGIKLQYQTSANGTSGWSDWADYIATSNTTGSFYNWSYNIDTTASPFTDETYVRFRAVATDEADNTGNTGTTTQYSADNVANNKLVKISQKTDRPVIRFTNLNLGTDTVWLKNTNTILGLISDDDGDVTALSYKLAAAESWTALTPVAGNGYFEITGIADGQSTFYFQTTDAAGKTFTTDTDATPNTLNEPILTDGTNKIENGKVELTLKVDKTSPTVQNKQYQIYNTEAAEDAIYGKWGALITENDVSTWTPGAWSSSLVTLGGKYTGLKVKLEAADQNAITSVTSTFAGNAVSFTCSETYNNAAYHPWATGEISIPNNVTEVRELSVVITDGAGITTTEAISIEIDNAAPVITIQDPSALIGTTETIRGNIATSTASESRDATLYYAVSRYDATESNVKPADSGKRMDGTTVLATAWTEIKGLTTALNWYVYFDDQTTFDDHTVRFAKYLTGNYLDITTDAAINNETYNTPTDLYFWVKAVDSVGNISTACKKVTVDPQGDRPSVTLTYPANNEYDEAPTLGGAIRLSGTATDNEQAKYVWVQIDKDNDGTFDATDLAYMNTNNGTTRTYGYKLGQISTNTEKSIYEIDMAVTSGTNISDYGIMVDVQGSNWNTIINSQLEYSPASGGMTTIQFIIYATDEHRNKSLPVTQTIRIDADSPVIVQQSLKLVQYERFDGTACTDGSVTSGTIANEIEYSEDMSIKGIWFLTGTISDPSGIREIFIDNVRKIDSAGQDYMNNIEGIILRHEYFDGNENNYYFQIPVGNNTSGEVGSNFVKLKVVEDTATRLMVEGTFSVKYDNKVPEIIATGNNVYLDENIIDSNGFYTLGAVASEYDVDGISQSGVDRIAFYFTRDLEYNIKTLDDMQYSAHSVSATQTHDLFDVMISCENKDIDDVTTGNTIIDYASYGDFDYDGIYTPGMMKTNYVYEDYLIWEKTTGTISGQAVTLTSVGKNVHVGGLIKIKGGIYKITGIAGNTINISGVPGDTASAVQVLCAIAGVVDSTDRHGTVTSPTKGYGYGYYYGNSLDNDNDLLVETFKKQGQSWIWDAAIVSTNIPDGPVTVHIVAMDKAGNASEYKYNATVSNNGPRIAGMKIGTDEDGDGTVEYDECDSTYSNLYVNGRQGSQKVTEATFPLQTGIWPTSAIKAKGQVEIIPEIIGGNGALKYTYDVFYRNAADDGWNTTADFSNSNPTNKALGTGGGANETVAALSPMTVTVEDFVKTKNGAAYNATSNNEVQIRDGNNHKFSFNIGDNTPTRTAYGNSQSVTLDVIMDVALGDSNSANNYILPFYWNSASSNSLFGNSKNNGHIEIAKDWVFATDYDSTVKTGEYDSDPKVSGKIKIEGIAQDDTLLKEIKVQFNKSMGGLGTTDTTIATYNDTGANAGTWTTTALTETTTTVNGVTTTTYDIPSSGWASEIQRATYGELLAAHIISELPTIGYTTVQTDDLVPYASQQFGHVVHWIFYLDTAYVQDVASTDVIVTATATDKGTPTWNGGGIVYTSNYVVVTNDSSGYSGKVTKTGNTVTEGEYTGKYKMDIVPYITSVTTALTNKLKSNLKTAYSRTALGHYIARSNETGIIISGFNLAGGTVNFTHETTDTTNYTTAYNTSGISIPTNARSGEMSVTVGVIETLNNKNNNNASGGTEVITEASLYETKNTYAYNRMPNRINNNLLTDDVVIDIWEFDSDAAKPNSGELREPVMKINPVTGKVGIAFASGTMDFAMPGNTTTTGVQASNTSENTSPSTKNQYSYSLWQNNYESYNNISLVYDDNGFAHATAAGLDTNVAENSKSCGKLSYFYNRWGRSGTSTSGNYEGVKAIRLESIAVPVTPTSGTGFTINGIEDLKLLVNGTIPNTDTISENRFNSSSLVTTVDGSNTAVYLAYYDNIQKQIRFRYNSAVTSSWAGTAGIIAHHKNDVDQFVDNFVRINKTATSSSTSRSDYDSYIATNSMTSSLDAQLYYESKTDYFSLIAGVDYQQGELREQDNAGNSGRCLTGYDTGYNAGKYVAIDAISKNSFNPVKTNDVVVAVWYDGEKLRYAYNDNPTSGLDNGSAGGWKGNKVIFADGGEHCAIKVDPLGGIHIAAYVEGSLRYAYLSSYDDATYVENYNSPTTNKAVIVDSFTLTGERITIDAGLAQVPGTTDYVVVPYISYYNNMAHLPVVAHPVIKSTMNYAAQGIDNTSEYQIFTGDWEVSLVPSPKTITTNSYDKINLALWKRAAANGTEPKGMIVTSLDSGFTGPAAGHTSVDNTSDEQCGHIYGNGTKNPIMGYAVETSVGTALETAQMR
ncbi:MAG: SUMF1/EgtB/PvdO family nonheme iron enzyme [Treponema sp.]|nr:SUMF1/EgtB/PvdO family nonheme iron enzyme [Treponema sp.]